jgi:hypothetical protein
MHEILTFLDYTTLEATGKNIEAKLSEKGHIGALEQSYRDALKKRFGYFYYPGGMFHGGWQTEKNVKRYLQRRPSVEEMKVLLHPIYYRYTYRPNNYKHMIGCTPDSDMKHVSQ